MIGHYSPWEAAAFGGIVIIALLVDLYAHRADKPVSLRDAGLWSAGLLLKTFSKNFRLLDSLSCMLFFPSFGYENTPPR